MDRSSSRFPRPAHRLLPVGVALLGLLLAPALTGTAAFAASKNTKASKPSAPAKAETAAPGQQPTAFPHEDTPGGSGDIAYGAYQRGYYRTAFLAAEKAIEEKGDPAAMVLLGQLYEKGFGVPADAAKAITWYRKAAAKGSTDAAFALGLMTLTGKGMPADEIAAAKLFRQAAEKGNGAAAYNLGLLYMQGQKMHRDMGAAARWFKIAADQDLEDAQYALAVLLKAGNGVPQDVPAAAKLMEKAANLGHVTAEVEFAIMQFNGIGVQKNEAAAADMFRKAALAGNAIAQNRYARILATGRGALKDEVAAVTWHLMAKSRGLGDPMLDELMAKLSDADRKKAEAQAHKWGALVAVK